MLLLHRTRCHAANSRTEAPRLRSIAFLRLRARLTWANVPGLIRAVVPCQNGFVTIRSLGSLYVGMPLQGRFISWAPDWRPGSQGFPPGQWRFDNAPTGLPGYPDMLQWEVRQRSHTVQTHG